MKGLDLWQQNSQGLAADWLMGRKRKEFRRWTPRFLAGESGMTVAHLTKEKTKELGDPGLSPKGFVESGCLLQGWKVNQPALYPVTGLTNSPLK